MEGEEGRVEGWVRGRWRGRKGEWKGGLEVDGGGGREGEWEGGLEIERGGGRERESWRGREREKGGCSMYLPHTIPCSVIVSSMNELVGLFTEGTNPVIMGRGSALKLLMFL